MGGKGSGGKNRKPTARKIAEGNRGKRPINKAEPKSLPGEPMMPAGMTKAAQAVWPDIIANLEANSVLFKTDSIAIAALCSSLVLFRQAEAAIQKYGSVIAELEEDTGVATVKMNPAVRVRSGALKELRAIWQDFGLSPSSRAGIAINKGDDTPESKLDALLHGKGPKDDVVN